MHHTIQHPLDVDSDFASECKTVQTLLRFYIGKNWLHNGKSLRIYFTTPVTIDFVLHRFGIIGLSSADRQIQRTTFVVLAANQFLAIQLDIVK
jgi:hypothetical protein